MPACGRRSGGRDARMRKVRGASSACRSSSCVCAHVVSSSSSLALTFSSSRRITVASSPASAASSPTSARRACSAANLASASAASPCSSIDLRFVRSTCTAQQRVRPHRGSSRDAMLCDAVRWPAHLHPQRLGLHLELRHPRVALVLQPLALLLPLVARRVQRACNDTLRVMQRCDAALPRFGRAACRPCSPPRRAQTPAGASPRPARRPPRRSPCCSPRTRGSTCRSAPAARRGLPPPPPSP